MGKTFGLDSAGYDIRIARTLIMWPLRFARADAIETFIIPNDLKPAKVSPYRTLAASPAGSVSYAWRLQTTVGGFM